jgi:hypothetical protein
VHNAAAEERVFELVRRQSGTTETWLLEQEIHDLELLGEKETGAGETYRLYLGDQHEAAYFKPMAGVNATIAYACQQTPYSATVAEAAAWQLAKGLGQPFSELITPCVLRWVDQIDPDRPGALLDARYGDRDDAIDVFSRGPRFIRPAGFFDALVGNQDRRRSNFLLDNQREVLALIDHGLAFATKGDETLANVFWEWRWRADLQGLDPWELKALEQLLADPDLLGLRSFLEPSRSAALEKRARRMLKTAELPPVGTF